MQGRPIIPKRLAATFATSAVLAAALATAALAQEKVLRIGMTAADIPKTHGQPDQGFEGNRFTGIPLYDALTHWDLSSADKPSVLIPGLATEWKVSDADKTKWVFKLRQGVKFHDGSDLKADAIVWNVREGARQGGAALRARPDRRHRQPHAEPGVGPRPSTTPRSSSPPRSPTASCRSTSPTSSSPPPPTGRRNTTRSPRSPTRQSGPSRPGPPSLPTPRAPGPSRWQSSSPRERAEYVKNAAYWDPKRQPKIDRVVLQPMPEANARTAALLSGQVDWIENPAPDAVKSIKAKGFVITATRSRTCGRGSSPLRRARPGSTRRCGTPPTSASTATS